MIVTSKKLLDKIMAIPLGPVDCMYLEKKYLITKEEYLNGKSLKVFARELGGEDFISFNLYQIQRGVLIKPCEMSYTKIENFILNCSI